MQRALHFSFATGCLLLAACALHAQATEDPAKAQEDFSLAVATAHARTSLFAAGSKPFAIHATVVSSLALHGTGKGTYDNQWVDAQHWRRVIKFPDYQQSEMRNDSGHSWVKQSSETLPLRLAELLRVVVIHVPSSTAAITLPVSEASTTGDRGEPTICYTATPPTPADGLPRKLRYCFEKASGLLASQDMPLNTHIAYSSYILFQGKHEFTHVHVTTGSLPVLDMDLQYSPLDSHALDASVSDDSMHRSQTAASSPNPEEIGRGTVEYRFNPQLPPQTSDEDKKQPVQLQFHLAADNTLLDACVENAPTQAMAESALQAARKFTYTAMTVDGKPAGNHFYYSVWFQSGEENLASPTGASEEHHTAGNANPPIPTTQKSGVYSSKEPPFTFSYPAGFQPVPRGGLEEDIRSSSGPHPGLDHGVKCTTLLLRAARLRPGQSIPESLSIMDLDPTCDFGLLDRKAWESAALNAAHNIVDRLFASTVSKPSRFTVNGRTFAVVYASGFKQRTDTEQRHALIVVTTIHDHVVLWMILGPEANILSQALADSTLQIGDGAANPLLPLSERP